MCFHLPNNLNLKRTVFGDYWFQDTYDQQFVKHAYDAPLLTVSQVQHGERADAKAVRVEYNKSNFKTVAKSLGIMEDLKVGNWTPRKGLVIVKHLKYKLFLSMEKDSVCHADEWTSVHFQTFFRDFCRAWPQVVIKWENICWGELKKKKKVTVHLVHVRWT